ncbi:hypothetical protein F6U93_14305 [Tamlana haliotis]|uniref:TerB family tellurite resistance protein n=1 Tax=Pseudotamlana haliotis TaxID=2614804 RepID=A0A6N6MAY6_9FLAO|nr:hypothetical protein [Tamlana haliotis]KAB1066586.1 hypothetical protein F6U93_14305 [Tamlana haliotis]
MVNILRNKRHRLGVKSNSDFPTYRMDLNNEQLEAMVHTFLMVMMADDAVFNLNMYNYIQEQFESLSFNIREAYVHKFAPKADEQAYEVLRELSDTQKVWFATAIYGMLYRLGDTPSELQAKQYNIVRKKALNTYMKEVTL